MQIDVLPYPNITGKTDVERLNNLIAYTTQLYNVLRVILTSLDTSNLTQDLAQKIENSIKEHQDLSEYSTTAYVDRADDELQDDIDTLYGNLDDVNERIDSEVKDLEGKVDDKADEDHDHDELYLSRNATKDKSFLEDPNQGWGLATKEWVANNFVSL